MISATQVRKQHHWSEAPADTVVLDFDDRHRRRMAMTVTPMLTTTSKPPPGEGLDRMNESEAAALYRLMTWLSPSFPVGAFSYSSGIEWAVESGDIADAASLSDWLGAMLAEGSGFCDG